MKKAEEIAKQQKVLSARNAMEEEEMEEKEEIRKKPLQQQNDLRCRKEVKIKCLK